jgi:hypothetical protein
MRFAASLQYLLLSMLVAVPTLGYVVSPGSSKALNVVITITTAEAKDINYVQGANTNAASLITRGRNSGGDEEIDAETAKEAAQNFKNLFGDISNINPPPNIESRDKKSGGDEEIDAETAKAAAENFKNLFGDISNINPPPINENRAVGS